MFWVMKKKYLEKLDPQNRHFPPINKGFTSRDRGPKIYASDSETVSNFSSFYFITRDTKGTDAFPSYKILPSYVASRRSHCTASTIWKRTVPFFLPKMALFTYDYPKILAAKNPLLPRQQIFLKWRHLDVVEPKEN